MFKKIFLIFPTILALSSSCVSNERNDIVENSILEYHTFISKKYYSTDKSYNISFYINKENTYNSGDYFFLQGYDFENGIRVCKLIESPIFLVKSSDIYRSKQIKNFLSNSFSDGVEIIVTARIDRDYKGGNSLSHVPFTVDGRLKNVSKASLGRNTCRSRLESQN